MIRVKVLFDKPMYAEQTILDISEIQVFDFHDDFIKSLLKERSCLMYTDTDSLRYEVESEDIYKLNCEK